MPMTMLRRESRPQLSADEARVSLRSQCAVERECMNPACPTLAEEKFLAGYNCAQAVLHSTAEDLGIDKNTALKIACGFGAGYGRAQEVCGAVSGAVMAIGLKHGRGEGEEKSRTEDTYRRTREFIAHFKQRHGSIQCRELIDCDLQTPEGQQSFKDRDLLHTTCARCVRTAADWVASAS